MDEISQKDLSRYLKAKKVFESLKKEIKSALDEGVECEPGEYKAKLKLSERRTVNYKEHLIIAIGEEAVQNIYDKTTPKEIKSLIVI